GSIQLITSHIIDAWIEGKKAAEKIANSELQMANSEKAKEESKIGGANGTAPNAAGANGTKVIDAPAVAKPVYKQSVAGRQRDKAKSEKKKADEKAAGLTKEKKQETKATPEKISVE
ncbi:MAG: hypothetical protein Q8Q49_01680, partial [bacterium]|nr:hypothetical protein [bacterium]